MEILHQTSPQVEQISIDEAYLDLTDHVTAGKEAAEIARHLQEQVKEEVGLSASLGVAANKLVAKVASDHRKPGGLTVVRPGEGAAFLAPLSVRVLWGMGPVRERKLAAMGVTTVGELARFPEEEMCAHFGRHGVEMARQAQGIVQRPVVTEHERKSVSQRIAQRLRRAELAAGTVAIKLRYADFTTLTRQMRLAVPTNDEREIYRAALVLLDRTWQRRRPVRLLGIAGQQLSSPAGQLPLF